MAFDSATHQGDTFNEGFCRELSDSVIIDEIRSSEGFQSLSGEQEAWFRHFAAPLLMREGLETGRAVARELAEEPVTKEEQLKNEAVIFLNGLHALNNELGR